MLLHYLKVAVRQMGKYRSHQLISALCLAVGIICFAYAWLFVYMVEQAYERPGHDRRVQVYLTKDKTRGHQERYSANDVLRLQDELRPLGVKGVSAASYVRDGEVEFIDEEGRTTPYLVKLGYVNAYYFAYMGIGVQGLTADELGQHDVVISAPFARRVFGNEDPVGQRLRLTGNGEAETVGQLFRIVGVADSDALGLETADCFFSMMLLPDVRRSYQVGTFLPEGMDKDSFAQHLDKQVWQRSDGSVFFYTRMENADDTQRHLAEAMFLVLASLILLSGLINFLKFIFQIFFIRQRELVLRKCMGSGLRGLYALLAAEVFLMLTLSLFLSLVLNEILVAAVDGRLPAEFPPPDFGKTCFVQGGIYLGALAVGLLAACFPVARLRRGTLHGFLQSARRKHTLRNWMIGLQMFISMFFVGGLLLVNSLWNETLLNGYVPLSPDEQRQVVALPLNSQYMRRHVGPILDEVRRMPEVEEITSFDLPLSVTRHTYMDYWRKDSTTKTVYMQSGDPAYFSFFRIPMEGRLVAPEAGNQVYVSRRLKQLLDEEGYDGTIRLDGTEYQVAGVYEAQFNEGNRDEAYFVGSVFLPSAYVETYYIRTGRDVPANAFMERLAQVCRQVIPPTLPLDIHLLTDENQARQTIVLMRTALVLLGIVSLLLVVLSIYSSISLDTLGRRKEVAIRKINGAKPADIFLLFARTYLYIFAVTYVLAYALLYIIGTKAFEFEPDITSVGSWQWPVLMLVLMAAVLAAVSGWKIWQVMRLNPAEAIKTE